ncbi:hypothetical protein D8B24_13185 [Verminephrobacter aporrectodeae subsp. tuberculatae]|nr:hypothetical protein [Verminephrobacter aporrectodeae subsp. tuberculatae]
MQQQVRAKTDLQAAQEMQHAKAQLFALLNKTDSKRKAAWMSPMRPGNVQATESGRSQIMHEYMHDQGGLRRPGRALQ